MSSNPQAAVAEDPIFESYLQIGRGLVGDLDGLCLLDDRLTPRGQAGAVSAAAAAVWVESLGWRDSVPRAAAATVLDRGHWLTALPVEQSDGVLLGVLCAQQPRSGGPPQAAQHAAELRRGLGPLLDCVHRELAAALPVRIRLKQLTDRTAELEWLFDVTGKLRAANEDPRVLEELVRESLTRLDSAYGVLWIPDKRILVQSLRDESVAEPLRLAWEQTRQHLLTWVQRQNRPLLINGTRRLADGPARCKILCAPVAQEGGRVIGVLAFYNPPVAADFAARQVFLSRHLGRQAAALVETQFDLMTGLYTHGGLEQAYAQSCSGAGGGDDDRSVIYIDLDHMHVVNELHGFEVGNELIVRIADLLGPPLLPEGALAARISADRFAVLLPSADVSAAVALAERLKDAARLISIGPADEPTEASISCGVASLVAMPQGLDRALAAAELACKTAKTRGRGRVEAYDCDDNSMMRRHGDAIAVGQLRAALKADRLLLYAQRIAPLRNGNLPGGYEILLRFRGEDGSLILPGPLIDVANRYQLLPTVDRWVAQRALQMLAPHRRMIETRGINFSLNVSGQSIGDAAFIGSLVQQIKASRLPANSLTMEITEQAAVTNMARANEMIRSLIRHGCQAALDDFGTGANSLIYLKNLQISRVKIDGSFVRDAATNRNSRAAVRAIVELAAGLAIDTVAEYVETEEVAAEMRTLGVDYGQGYALGRPEPLDALLAGLSADESQRLHRLFLET